MQDSTDQSSLSLSTMVILGRLGRGGTSHVFKAQSTKNKKLYAMKVIDKTAKNYDYSALERELSIHKRLLNDHVVRLQGHFQDSDNHYVVTEYCQGGEMTRLITEDLSEQKIASIIHQIVLGLQYLHNQGVAHCDIKLSNMLIHKGRIKLCDFGFSQNINDPSVQKQKSLCGTLYYLAPEILKDKKRIHHKQADIWGLGISLLVLLTKKQPYSGEGFQVLRRQIIAGQRQKLPKLSSQLNNLMQRMLQMHPQKRIELNQILAHSFLLKYTNNINSEITASKAFSKQHKKLNDKIQVVSRLTSQSQSEEKEMLQSYKDGGYFEQEKIENKQQYNKKDWTFKRIQSVSNQSQKNDYTVHKRISKVQSSTDYDKTIRNSKSIKHQANKIQYLAPIQSRLIKPFDEFYYQTKNEGFIKILPDAQLIIKVKNITYQISSDGQTLNFMNKQFKLKQINAKYHLAQYKQPYQLYAYAKQVVDILKSKKYAITWTEKYKDKDLSFAISLDWKKIKCMSISKNESVLLQWVGSDPYVNIKRKGQKSFCKLIGELEQLQAIFILMKDYFQQKSAQEQVQ